MFTNPTTEVTDFDIQPGAELWECIHPGCRVLRADLIDLVAHEYTQH